MKHHAGILHGQPEWDRAALLVLAHTPGIPLEWIYHTAKLGWRRRRKLVEMIDASREGEFPALGLENAASVVDGDGWKMLRVLPEGYNGAVPLWSQLELQRDERSDQAIADVLGVSRKKVQRWRTKAVFDPLTGVRLVSMRSFG